MRLPWDMRVVLEGAELARYTDLLRIAARGGETPPGELEALAKQFAGKDTIQALADQNTIEMPIGYWKSDPSRAFSGRKPIGRIVKIVVGEGPVKPRQIVGYLTDVKNDTAVDVDEHLATEGPGIELEKQIAAKRQEMGAHKKYSPEWEALEQELEPLTQARKEWMQDRPSVTAIRVPRTSQWMEEGVITAWHVGVGDTVEVGQEIFDVEIQRTLEQEISELKQVTKSKDKKRPPRAKAQRTEMDSFEKDPRDMRDMMGDIVAGSKFNRLVQNKFRQEKLRPAIKYVFKVPEVGDIVALKGRKPKPAIQKPKARKPKPAIQKPKAPGEKDEGTTLDMAVRVSEIEADENGALYVGVIEKSAEKRFPVGKEIKFRFYPKGHPLYHYNNVIGVKTKVKEMAEVNVDIPREMTRGRQEKARRAAEDEKKMARIGTMPEPETQAALNVVEDTYNEIRNRIGIGGAGLHGHDEIIGAEGISSKNWIALSISPNGLWTVWRATTKSDPRSLAPDATYGVDKLGYPPSEEMMKSPSPKSAYEYAALNLQEWDRERSNYIRNLKHPKGNKAPSAVYDKLSAAIPGGPIELASGRPYENIHPSLPKMEAEPEDKIDTIASQMGPGATSGRGGLKRDAGIGRKKRRSIDDIASDL
jgi:hypothetical protein